MAVDPAQPSLSSCAHGSRIAVSKTTATAATTAATTAAAKKTATAATARSSHAGVSCVVIAYIAALVLVMRAMRAPLGDLVRVAHRRSSCWCATSPRRSDTFVVDVLMPRHLERTTSENRARAHTTVGAIDARVCLRTHIAQRRIYSFRRDESRNNYVVFVFTMCTAAVIADVSAWVWGVRVRARVHMRRYRCIR